MSDTQKTAVAILGAAGEIGSLAAGMLARESSRPLVLIGRNRERLLALSRSLGGSETDIRDRVRCADLHDPAAMQAALERCALVINCTGPSWRLSLPAAKAALAAGAALVDVGGYEKLFDELGALARQDPEPFSRTSFVVSAGWMPGLSEVFSRLVLNTAALQGKPVRLDLVCGAREHWSLASVSDMIWHLGQHSVARFYANGEAHSIPFWKTMTRDEVPHTGRARTLRVDNAQFSEIARAWPDVRFECRLALLTARTLGAMSLIRAGLGRFPTAAARLLQSAIGADARSGPGAFGFLDVRVTCEDGRTLRGLLESTENHRLTAAGAVGAAQLVLSGQARPGVSYLGDAVPASAFMEHMAAEGVTWRIEDV